MAQSDAAALCTIVSDIDLDGRPGRERLIVMADDLRVEGEAGRRQWRFADVSEFRVEPALGSCYLQGRVGDSWEDVLRRPGEDDDTLAGLAERLNVRSRTGRWPEAVGKAVCAAAEGGEPVWAHLQNLRRLVRLIRPFRRSVLLVLGLSFLTAGIEMAVPLLQRILVDRVLSPAPGLSLSHPLFILVMIVAALLIARLTNTVFAIWRGRVSSWLGSTLTAGLRQRLVAKLNELPLAFHDRNQVGMLMSRVAYDTEALHTLVYHMTSGLLLELLQLVVIVIMLFYLNPKLALMTMIPMPFIAGANWYFVRYLNPRHHHYWEAVGKQAAALTGMLSGIRVVKAFAQEKQEDRRFRDSSLRLRDSRQVVDFSTWTFGALMGFLFALGTLAVWYIGGRDVLGQQMSLGTLVAYLAYLAMFFTPLTSLAQSTSSFSNVWTASLRIFEILDRPGESYPARSGSPPRVPSRDNGVEFQNVSFGYQRNQPVLRGISFSIPPGQFVGVAGRSGSGKSTLVSLLGRLYEADSGRILVGGVDTREMDSRELRRRIGMVLQDPFLFRGSVSENIAYGNREATPDMILRAAKLADAHDFILRMPFAYESQLGDTGSGLSGGERQRLSIARALLMDPRILVLDEATSNVDAESERSIRRSIRLFSRGRTTIAIAHRLPTLEEADQIIVLDHGRLVEKGTHVELLKQGGLYSGLFALASGRPEKPERWLEEEAPSVLPPDPPGNPVETGTDAGAEPSREIRWLEPGGVVIEDDGRRLSVSSGRTRYAGAAAFRTFPLSHQDRWISLRFPEPSGRELELGMIEELSSFPEPARGAVRRALERRYLFHNIREIRQLYARGPKLRFSVETESGPMKFTMEKTADSSRRFGDRGYLLMDGIGNWYVIPDRTALHRRQQSLLSLYLGD